MNLIITRKEACELIRSSIGKEMPKKNTDTFNKIVFAVNNDMQVRDFLIGLPAYYDTQQVIDFLGHMATVTDIGEDVPFITVSGMLAYESGHMDHFYKSTGWVSVHQPEYSLHKLVLQIANKQLPGEYLTKAREDLHKKVMEVCYVTEPDFIITNEKENPTQTDDDDEVTQQ